MNIDVEELTLDVAVENIERLVAENDTMRGTIKRLIDDKFTKPTLFAVHDPARHMQLLGTATLRKVGQ